MTTLLRCSAWVLARRRRKTIFAVMINIIFPVAVTDMNFGLNVKVDFESLKEQQLALKAEGLYLQKGSE